MQRKRRFKSAAAGLVLLAASLSVCGPAPAATSDDAEARAVAKSFWVSKFAVCKPSYFAARTTQFLVVARDLSWEVRSDRLASKQGPSEIEWSGSTAIRCDSCDFFHAATHARMADGSALRPVQLRFSLRKQNGAWGLTDESGSEPELQPAPCADIPAERPRLVLARCDPEPNGSAVTVQSVESCTNIYMERTSPSEVSVSGGQPVEDAPSGASEAALQDAEIASENAEQFTFKRYLQVAALAGSRTQEFVDTLKHRGFPVVVQRSAIQGTFRILVGPFEDERRLYSVKAQIERDGFTPIVRNQLRASASDKSGSL